MNTKETNNKRKKSFLDIIMLVVGLNIIFNDGFSNLGLRLGSMIIPVNQIILMIGLARIAFSFKVRTLRKRYVIFIALSVVSCFRMLADFTKFGAWALRDGTHLMDMLFIWVVDNEMRRDSSNPVHGKRLWDILDMICWVSFAMTILLRIPVASGILKSISYNGVQRRIRLFTAIFAQPWQNVFAVIHAARISEVSHSKRIIYSLHIYITIVNAFVGFEGSRANLISLLTVGFVLILLGKKSIVDCFDKKIILVLFFGGLLLATGIMGYINSRLSIDYFVQITKSIWGSGTYKAKADGVALRLGWWFNIIQETCSTVPKFLFGQGFGKVLTNFFAPGAIQVREPHNSFLSMFARTGISGLLIFLIGILSSSYIYGKRMFLKNQKSVEGLFVIIMIIVFSVVGLVECPFEMTYLTMPFYSLLTIMNARLFEQDKNNSL